MAKTEPESDPIPVEIESFHDPAPIPVSVPEPLPIAFGPSLTAPQSGCIGYIDPTPLMSVSSDVEGLSPNAGVLIRKGTSDYTHAAAAAVVSCGLGQVSAKDRATLEASGLLNPAEGTKE